MISIGSSVRRVVAVLLSASSSLALIRRAAASMLFAIGNWLQTGALLAPATCVATVLAATSVAAREAGSETLASALAKAYVNNPTLNAQRAQLRALDETTAQAKSLARPTVSISADAAFADNEGKSKSLTGQQRFTERYSFLDAPRGTGITVSQTLLTGNRISAALSSAESQVLGGREALRSAEQNQLLAAVTAYMNVLRETAIHDLRRNQVEVLSVQLQESRDRAKWGEATVTDVAQAEARLASARSDMILSLSQLKSSIANYRQQIGTEPRHLLSAPTLDALLPVSLEQAHILAQLQHPAIIASLHGVDVQRSQIVFIQSDLYPTLALTASSQGRFDAGSRGSTAFAASATAQLSVPVYEGGLVYARVRQAKETLGEQQLNVEAQRDAVRAAVTQAWGQLNAAKAQIIAVRAQVRAAEEALSGVRSELIYGQRTTIDVLNAQQELLNARVSLIIAQRDRIVGTYAVLSAVGALDAAHLKLDVKLYDPADHYERVKDRWFGLRTPDGG